MEMSSTGTGPKEKPAVMVTFFLCFFVFFVLPLQVTSDPVSHPSSLDDVLVPVLAGTEQVFQRQLDPTHLEKEYHLSIDDQLKSYEIAAKGIEIAETCITLMKKEGWLLVKENWQSRGGEFYFKKDIIFKTKMKITPLKKPEKGKMKTYISMKYDILQLIPFTDIIGMDPPDVPRFPGSVRVRWMNLLGDFSAKYVVVAKLEDVQGFFKKELPNYGWELTKGAAHLNFIKKGSPPANKTVTTEGLKQPFEMVKGLVPTTLGLRFNDKDGIIEIGLGRDAGSADRGKSFNTTLRPPKMFSPPQPGERTIPRIDMNKDIPLFPGLEKIVQKRSKIDLQGKETTKMQLVKKSAPLPEALEMADFYKEELAKRSWQLADEEWYGIGRKLFFQQESTRLKIEIKAVGRYPFPGKDKTRKINIPVTISLVHALPLAEPAGEDIPGIPRFPGSIRFYTLKAGIDHIVKFKAVATVEEVQWFFIQTLPQHGWIFAANDSTGLMFVPGGTPGSAASALAKGQLIPTTLKIKVDDCYDGTVKIGMDKTKGDS